MMFILLLMKMLHLLMITPHQSIIPLLLHPLEHLLIIRQSSLLDYLAHLPLDATAYHPVDGVLLSLDYLVFVYLLLVVRVDFRMEG